MSSSSNSRASSQRDTPSGTRKESHSLFDSDSDEDLPCASSEIDTRIETELHHYSMLKFNAEQKKETHVHREEEGQIFQSTFCPWGEWSLGRPVTESVTGRDWD